MWDNAETHSPELLSSTVMDLSAAEDASVDVEGRRVMMSEFKFILQ